MSSDCLYEGRRCCSPETVQPIRSNRSDGAVVFAPIRKTEIARPKMDGFCSDFWKSRLQSVQSLSSPSESPVLLIEDDSKTTLTLTKRRNACVIPLYGCDVTVRAVRRKGDPNAVSSSEMQILPLANLLAPISVCD